MTGFELCVFVLMLNNFCDVSFANASGVNTSVLLAPEKNYYNFNRTLIKP